MMPARRSVIRLMLGASARRPRVLLGFATFVSVSCDKAPETIAPLQRPNFSQLEITRKVQEIGVLPGAENPQSSAYDANDVGEVVGYSFNAAGCTSAFHWKAGRIRELPALGGASPCTTAFAINARGTIAGGSSTDQGQGFSAVVWNRGSPVDLGLGDQSFATAVNDRGDVVGLMRIAGSPRAFLIADGVLTDLGTLGGEFSVATGINESRQVVGSADDASGAPRAFLWENGSMIDLGALGGLYSSAADVNETGQVVGSAVLPSGATHAFLWSNGVMTDLGTLGGTISEANGINDFGQVVGTSRTSAATFAHAFLWSDGAMTDLGTLPDAIVSSSEGRAITAGGYIAGGSSNATRGLIATLWTFKKPKS